MKEVGKPAAELLREIRHQELAVELSGKIKELFKSSSIQLSVEPWGSFGVTLVQHDKPDRDFLILGHAIDAVQAMIDAVRKERSDMKVYLRNLIAAHPQFGKEWTVINIDVDGDMMLLDLDDGTTIRLDIERYPTGKTVSTNWGFICTSHVPELGSPYDGICGSGDYGKDRLTEFWQMRERLCGYDDELFEAWVNDDSNRRETRFLRRHPNCTIIIVNEYGVRFDPATAVRTPSRRDTAKAIVEVTALVQHARKISNSQSMTLYVTDVELALGLIPPDIPRPHLKGQSSE